MKNKTACIGLVVTALLFLLAIGLLIYINGRPCDDVNRNQVHEAIDCDYHYMFFNGSWLCKDGVDCDCYEFYYLYGSFAWENVDWSNFFAAFLLLNAPFFLLPWFIYFGSKIKGTISGVHNSGWFKAIMCMSVIPLVLVFMFLFVEAQTLVPDYPESKEIDFFLLYLFTSFIYCINLILWVIVRLVKLCKKYKHNE